MRNLLALACVSGLSLVACTAEPDAGPVTGDTQEVVGKATLTLAAEGNTTSGSVILGPQAKSVVPRVAFACGTAPSATEEAPTAWVELKNPSPKAAVVSFWTGELDGGPSMLTSLFAYASPNRPTTAAELAKCGRTESPRQVSYSMVSGSFDHARGSALFVPGNSSVWVLVTDAQRKVGAMKLAVKTDVLVEPGPAAPIAVGPGAPQQQGAVLVLSPSDAGIVPANAFECGSTPSSTRLAPRAWVEVKNPTASTAVVSLRTRAVDGGPSMLTTLLAYDAPTAPTTAAELAKCSASATPRQVSYSMVSGSFDHARGNALVLDAGQSAWVLVTDAYGATGASQLVATTEHTDP